MPNATALSPSIRCATPADLGALTDLVNRAYQVEAFFVEGDRTTPDEVRALAEAGKFLVLDAGGELAAAVYVRPEADADAEPGAGPVAGSFGMLSASAWSWMRPVGSFDQSGWKWNLPSAWPKPPM